jgi:hypothetical protein
MIGEERRPILPKPVIVAALMVLTIAASVLICALVVDADSRPPELPRSIELVHASAIVPARGLLRLDAKCRTGEAVTGGGTYADAVSPTLLVLDNMPVRTGGRSAWRVRFNNKSAREIRVGSVAICTKVAASDGSTARARNGSRAANTEGATPARPDTGGRTTRQR